MASSPQWKVYDSEGIYQAACKEIESASILVTWYGTGSTIRKGHSQIVWTEGKDGEASDTFEYTAQFVGV